MARPADLRAVRRRRVAKASHYSRPGGAWAGPLTLDALLEPVPVRDDRRQVSAADLAEEVATTAGALRTSGVRRGDAVSWQLPGSIEVVVLYRACWRLGAIAAPVHHRAGPADRERMLAQVDPTLVIDDDDLGRLRRRAESAARVVRSPTRPEDPAVVVFTSGSAGASKGVLHTHRALAGKAGSMPAVHGLTSADAVLMPAPLAHVSGLLNGVLVPGAAGMATTIAAQWDPAAAARSVERDRITFMVGPPTFFHGLADVGSDVMLRSLRLVSCGGAGVTRAFVEEVAGRLAATVKRTYGSSEAPTVATSRPGDEPARAATTDGRATPDTELRIAGDGEILVRGPEVTVGYLDPAATARAFTGGWFHTGDLGRLDAGWLTVSGRKRDVIIRGGENVSTALVESTLEAHPAVGAAVAVGVADRVLGERVGAVVVASARFDLDEATSWFAARGVGRLAWPERLLVLDALPVLESGKPDRAACRHLLTDR